MENFNCDLLEYNNRGKWTDKRFTIITFAIIKTWKRLRGHYFLPYGLLLGQYF